MNLNELAEEEFHILDKVRGIEGLIEQKEAELESSGIFDNTRRVYNKYVDLAVRGDIEALKRALFLWWFDFIEPSFLTGLHQLDGWEVLEQLEALTSTNKLDKELEWMLPYYYSITDYYFDAILENDLPALRKFLDENKNTSLPCKDLLSASLERRGQMGDYWLSMRKHCEELCKFG